MFDFKTSMKKGMESAEKVNHNLNEVKNIFKKLNEDLYSFDPRISLVCARSLMLEAFEAAISKQLSDIPKSLKGTLDIKFEQEDIKLSKSIGKWEQHPDGYPFTLEYLDSRTDCWDQQSVVETLNMIVSSGQFWLIINELKSKKHDKPS